MDADLRPDAVGVDDAAADGDAVAEDDDDVVVLSWWQHPANVIALVVATALLAGMVGWLIADTAASEAGNEVDAGFLQDMRIHHEQAVQMAYVFRDLPDTDPGLRTVAGSILIGQNIDIGRMIQLLRAVGAPEAAETDEAMGWMGMPTTHDAMPGMASDDDLAALTRSSGAEADRRFVELMVAHHEGGVHMAEYAAEHADHEQVRRLATSVVEGQRGEVVELEDRLAASAG